MASSLRNGTSIKPLEPSKTSVKEVNLWTSRMVEDLKTFKFGRPTVDGGNNSNSRENALSALRPEKYLKLKVELIKKVKLLLCHLALTRDTKDGRLSTVLKNPSKRLEVLTKLSDSGFRDHSS